MIINKLNFVYEWINKLNPNIKTLIIIILGIFILQHNYIESIKEVTEITSKTNSNNKELAEAYITAVAPEINKYVKDILEHDPQATNVVLLNYHNNIASTSGLSYLFVTALTEKKRGFETKSSIKIWTELAYINYEDELSKINSNGYLELNKVSDGYENFPKLSELLVASGAKAAGFYPLIGVDGPVGLVVIMYGDSITHTKDYYHKALAPYTQPLSTLLNYNAVEKKYLK